LLSSNFALLPRTVSGYSALCPNSSMQQQSLAWKSIFKKEKQEKE
jgi:hypothetical protein